MNFPSKILCCLCFSAGLLLSGCAYSTYSSGSSSPTKFIETSKVQDILDKAEYSTKKMRELKVDPVGSPLVKSYETFVVSQEAKDSSLIDSIRFLRRTFFEQWKQESDSICGTVDASDSMAFEIRSIYETALRFRIESVYDFELKIRDSLHYEERRDVPFENKVEYFRSNNIDGLGAHFFVVENQVAYFVKPAKTLKVLKAFADSIQGESGSYKVANMACMDKNPMGQETLVLTQKYSTLLDAFMGVSREHRSWFSSGSNLKAAFLEPAISVWPEHWGNGFHYESFPANMSVVFNENRTLAILNVMSSFNGGGYYSLEKRDGVWKAIAYKRTWIM